MAAETRPSELDNGNGDHNDFQTWAILRSELDADPVSGPALLHLIKSERPPASESTSQDDATEVETTAPSLSAVSDDEDSTPMSIISQGTLSDSESATSQTCAPSIRLDKLQPDAAK